ncbi:MAG: hypothetical protein R3E32_28650 [Chitinophagales bacterium]
MQTPYFSPSKSLLILLVFLSTAAIFHACVKEQDIIKESSAVHNSYITPTDDDQLIYTNIFGLVVDENENPIGDCEVLLKTINGFKTTTTDEFGNFTYFNALVLRKGAFVKIRKVDKFEGFRKINVTENSYNYTKIKLLDKKAVGSVTSIVGGKLTHESGAQIELPANGVRYQNGATYTGSVEVVMSWIDPTSQDLTTQMVGDLSGIDSDGKQVALQTFGMLTVELLANNGEELQLKEGKTAMLSFPVPTEILAQAPPTIPLWYYDEELGTWVEEGSATLQDGFYVGEVSHFSSWNVDVKTERIAVRGTVFTQINEVDLVTPYLQVLVTIEGMGQYGGYLDKSGEFEFYNFPSNTPFTLTVLDRCAEVIFEEEFEGFSVDTDLGTLAVLAQPNNFVTVTGSGVGCDGNVVTDGYVLFKLNGNSTLLYPLKEDGAFEFVVNVCNETEGEISLVDLTTNKTNGFQPISLFSNPTNIGEMEACEEILPPSIVALIGSGLEFYFDLATAVVTPSDIGGYSILIKGLGTEHYYDGIRIEIDNVTGTGTYQNVRGSVVSNNSATIIYNFLFIESTTSMEITHFSENLGGRIRGTFKGQVRDKVYGSETYLPISGTFDVIR